MRRGKSIRGCGSLGILLRIRKGPREDGERLKEQSMKEKSGVWWSIFRFGKEQIS